MRQGSSGQLSDVFIILASYECSCHIYPKAKPGYAKNAELGLHRGLNKLFCRWIISPKKARILSVLPTIVGMALHPGGLQ